MFVIGILVCSKYETSAHTPKRAFIILNVRLRKKKIKLTYLFGNIYFN